MKKAIIASSVLAMSMSFAGVVKKTDGYYLEKECGFNSFKFSPVAYKIRDEDKIYSSKKGLGKIDADGCLTEEKLDFVEAKEILIVRARDVNGVMQNIAQYAVPAGGAIGGTPTPVPVPPRPTPGPVKIYQSIG